MPLYAPASFSTAVRSWVLGLILVLLSAIPLTAADPGADPQPFAQPATARSAVVLAAVGPPVITSPITATATVGTLFSYQIVASEEPVGFDASGLPAGLAVDTANGVISGIPTGAGISAVTISATNGFGTGSAILTLTVVDSSALPPVITSPLNASGSVGVAFAYTITATNLPTSFSATGLPTGLAVNPTTGDITGVPVAASTSTVTIAAGNARGSGSALLTLTIVDNGGYVPPPPSSGGYSAGGGCGAGSGVAGAAAAMLVALRLALGRHPPLPSRRPG